MTGGVQGEQGIMLTTLMAAYHQMLKESVFIDRVSSTSSYS